MKLQTIKNALTSKVGRQVLHLQKHSPQILFVAGVVGVVGTVVLASRATLKLDEVLDEHSRMNEKIDDAARGFSAVKYLEEDYKRDKVVLYTKLVVNIGKLYGPALLVGVASIAALTGSHVVLNNRVTNLTAAYVALDKAYRRYQDRVKAEVGEEKERSFHYDTEDVEIVEETAEGPVVKTVARAINGKSPYARVFDEASSPNWESSWMFNQTFLRTVQNYMNDLLRSRGHLFLNEVYDALGLERSKQGAVVGWVLDGGSSDNYVDFGIFGDAYEGIRFVKGDNNSVWLDFNVDGVIFDKI